jgi:hypothetical protein
LTRSSMPARSSMPRRLPVQSSLAARSRWRRAHQRQRVQSSATTRRCRWRGAWQQHAHSSAGRLRPTKRRASCGGQWRNSELTKGGKTNMDSLCASS